MSERISRREFLRQSLAGSAGLAIWGLGWDRLLSVQEWPWSGEHKGIPTRTLGKTGLEVTILGLGGGGVLLRRDSREEAVALINRAIDLGINYFDTAPSYGPCHEFLGEVMKTRRGEVHVATKTLARDRDGALRELEGSLKTLNTDHVDVWQVHSLENEKEVASVLRPDGVIRAMEEAKADGRTRFIGITSHATPRGLAAALKQYNFDTVLLPMNPTEVGPDSHQGKALPVALERGVGVVAMKPVCGGPLLRQDGLSEMSQVLGYVWSLPISSTVPGCNALHELEWNVQLARQFLPLTPDEMAGIEAVVAPYADQARFYRPAKEPA